MVAIRYLVSGGYNLREVLTETENVVISTRAPEVSSEEIGTYSLDTDSIGELNIRADDMLVLDLDTKITQLGVSGKIYIPKMDADLIE